MPPAALRHLSAVAHRGSLLYYQELFDCQARQLAIPSQLALLLLLLLLLPPLPLLTLPPAPPPLALLQLYCAPGCGLP